LAGRVRRSAGFLLLCTVVPLVNGCGGDRPAQQDPGRAKYEADRTHCDSISSIEAARKSCMTYRGWPDGKYRR
jgi:hypothetical protein